MHLPSGPVFLLFTRAQQRMNPESPPFVARYSTVPISLSPTHRAARVCVDLECARTFILRVNSHHLRLTR